MFLPRLALAVLLGLALPALAQTTVETTGEPTGEPTGELTGEPATITISRLGEVMQLDALFDVLHQEGLAYGAALEAEMFPGGGGPGWAAEVARIHAPRRLRARFNQVLRLSLAGDAGALAEIDSFFASGLGSRILILEIEARRAFLDTATEEAARVAADKRRSGRDPRARQIDRFIAAGDLLEMNVAGGLSGNLAFLTGLNETGVNGLRLPQDELLSQVWGQEAQIRDDTQTWLHAYLGLAYDPLTEAELDSYIAFWESPAGQRLNAALFAAFEATFSGVSRDLGRAAGAAMLGQDI